MCLYIAVCQSTQTAYVGAGDLLRVLSAPARLAIVVELAHEPLQVNELVERLELSQPLVSQHLRVLRGRTTRGGGAPRSRGDLLAGRPARGPHRRGRHTTQSGNDQSGNAQSGNTHSPTKQSRHKGGHAGMSEHTVHGDHHHEHGPSCGHATVEHGDHADYIHDGHTHCAHDDHYDERPLDHVAHADHGHVHGDGLRTRGRVPRRSRRLRARRTPPRSARRPLRRALTRTLDPGGT